MAATPRYVVRVGDRTLEEIQSISLRFAMREIADRVSVQFADRVPLDGIREGDPIGVAVEGRIVLVGEVQNSQLQKSADNRSMSLTAFSASQRLVKSSVIIGDGLAKRTSKDLSLRQIVEAVVSPFDLVVDVAASAADIADEPISKSVVEKGELAWNYLSELAMRQGCILVSGAASVTADRQAKASIMIARVAARRSPIAIVSPRPRVLSIGWENDARAIQSQYIVTRSGGGTRQSNGEIKGLDGIAYDERVPYSPVIIQARKGGDTEGELARQAEWEMRKRAAEGHRVTVTIEGWSPNYSQALFWPNTIYRVEDEEEGYAEDLVLTSVELTVDAGSGTRASLEFLPPDAYAILAVDKITAGSRRGFRANKDWLKQHCDLVTKIAADTDTVDFDRAKLELIWKPEDPDA